MQYINRDTPAKFKASNIVVLYNVFVSGAVYQHLSEFWCLNEKQHPWTHLERFFLSAVYCAFHAAKTKHIIYIELSGISKCIYKAVFS